MTCLAAGACEAVTFEAMRKILVAAACAIGLFMILAPETRAAPAETGDAQRGCCSHHGGVCGCSGHTTMCCDGGASPSCQCRAEGD